MTVAEVTWSDGSASLDESGRWYSSDSRMAVYLNYRFPPQASDEGPSLPGNQAVLVAKRFKGRIKFLALEDDEGRVY